MKVYMVYRVLDDNGKSLEYPTFYGFTTEKELIKKFKSQRKVEMYEFKTHNMTAEEIVRMSDKMRGYRLITCRYRHYPDGNKPITIELVGSTREEEDIVLRGLDKILEDLSRYVMPLHKIMHPDIVKDLKDVYYLDVLKYKMTPVDPFLNGFDEAPREMINVKLDELKMFYRLHGDTLNIPTD